MFKGRKHFGPLDLAPARAKLFCENITKVYMLNELVESIKQVEEIIEKGNPEDLDVIMANIVKNQLDKQLLDFLGLEDGKGQISEIPSEKI